MELKLELLGCGYRYNHPDGNLIDRPQGSGDYAFVFFRNRSEVVVGRRRTICERDSYILFGPFTPHSYRESELPFVNDRFHCVGDGMAELLAELSLPLNTLLPATDPRSSPAASWSCIGFARRAGRLRSGSSTPRSGRF